MNGLDASQLCNNILINAKLTRPERAENEYISEGIYTWYGIEIIERHNHAINLNKKKVWFIHLYIWILNIITKFWIVLYRFINIPNMPIYKSPLTIARIISPTLLDTTNQLHSPLPYTKWKVFFVSFLYELFHELFFYWLNEQMRWTNKPNWLRMLVWLYYVDVRVGVLVFNIVIICKI